MGILINNMKIIHTSAFTIIHTNCNHYLETTQRKQREIIRRKESVSHKEDTIDEYIYYIKKSLKIESFISLCIIETVGAIVREYKPWIVLLITQ